MRREGHRTGLYGIEVNMFKGHFIYMHEDDLMQAYVGRKEKKFFFTFLEYQGQLNWSLFGSAENFIASWWWTYTGEGELILQDRKTERPGA